MTTDTGRNTIIFIIATALLLLVYNFFVLEPLGRHVAVGRPTDAQVAFPASSDSSSPLAEVMANRSDVLTTSARVPIQTSTISGSLSLVGGRIDDLFLLQYRTKLDKNSPPVELFRPQGMEHAYFAQFGWQSEGAAPGLLPGANAQWRLASGSVLTSQTPVVLVWENEEGVRVTRTMSVDNEYVISIQDELFNGAGTSLQASFYGMIERDGIPENLGKQLILHEGAIGTFGEGRYRTRQVKYNNWTERRQEETTSRGGWLGITDKYWLAAVLPDQSKNVIGLLTTDGKGSEGVHRAIVQEDAVIIADGETLTRTYRLFAGAKRTEILQRYQQELGLPRFTYAIDWGMFWFLTRPIFALLESLHKLLGNFGTAIVVLTILVKVALLPLGVSQFRSMRKMQALNPTFEKIKLTHKADPQAQQKAMMDLYHQEKINPLAGCFPLLPQIPIFYALYKVLFVTIEMRHAPFFGWIRDLSARDPSTVWNLFGLLPYEPANVALAGSLLDGPLHIGALPVLYGLSMWAQMHLTPNGISDPLQRRIFMLMPLILTFALSSVASGLLLYWIFSNLLTAGQQIILRRTVPNSVFARKDTVPAS